WNLKAMDVPSKGGVMAESEVSVLAILEAAAPSAAQVWVDTVEGRNISPLRAQYAKALIERVHGPVRPGGSSDILEELFQIRNRDA
ncbi:MAG TPA: hypothetical protein VGL16_06450, partial [Actinomycetota bacterium]